MADASHELRTPLTSVRGYAELFRRGAAERPDDLAKAMRRIEAEAARMGVLVDDLLLLARLDQGRPLEREPVDLSALVTELVADARAIEPDRPIELEAATDVRGVRRRRPAAPGGRQPARQRPRALRRRDAHQRPGGGRRAGQRGGGRPRAGDRRPKRPSACSSASSAPIPRAARASGGTGLGLSIVASIAEAHGGRAELVETSEHGTTFRIVLPLAAAGHAGDQPSEPVPTAEQQ